MKKSYLFILLTILFFTNSLFAQYQEVSIKDIQFQPADSLLAYGKKHSEPKPPLAVSGDTVIVSGVVMCSAYEGANPDSTKMLHAGAAAIYLQDPNNRDWSGILVRDPDASDAFALLDTGLVIKFKAVVNEYFTTTQLNTIDFQASDIQGQVSRPKPVLLTLDSLVERGTGNPKFLAEKWEGVYVEIKNVTSTDPAYIGYNTFRIFDDNNSIIVVGNNSDYFRRTKAPLPGTKIESIRGFIETRTNIEGGWFIINPVYPDDIKYGEVFPPNISEITRDKIEVKYGDAVTVSAKIKDKDGTVASAQIVYDVNGVAQTPVEMAATDSIWSGVIPAQNDSSLVSFFIKAFDDQGNVTNAPNDTVKSKYFYFVLNRPLTIKDVQLSPFGSGYSAYNHYEVTVEGVITADTSDIPGDGRNGAKVYVQDGSGAWRGVLLFGTETQNVKRGDKISVKGIVNETYGVTRIGNLDAGAKITLLQSGVDIPAATEVLTAIIGSGGVDAEAYESVLIKYTNVKVVDDNADGDSGPDQGTGGSRNHGEMLVADGSGVGTRVELQDGGNDYHNFWDASLENQPIKIIQGSDFDEIIGVLFYSYGNYKLIPRKNDDFVGYTDVDNEVELPEIYSLSQNYPNPFNPTTVIQYSLPEVSNVKLRVYDMLGREVATLVNKEQTAGVYNVQFNAANLSSGVYFYRIEAGNFVASKKLLLLK